MNTNLIHNALLLLQVLLTALVGFDFTTFGMSASTAATAALVINGAISVVKFGINFFTVGATGLVTTTKS